MSEKQLYLSNNYIRLGYTPENNYDPRYYDMDEIPNDNDEQILNYITKNFGEDSYHLLTGGGIYTTNPEVMKVLQNEFDEPLWFDSTGYDETVAEELERLGYTWDTKKSTSLDSEAKDMEQAAESQSKGQSEREASKDRC